MDERFGIPAARFDEFLLLGSRRSWFLLRKSGALAAAARLKIEQAGLKAFQQVGAFVKPTTRFIQLFGHLATRARVVVDREMLARLTAGERIPVDSAAGQGYLILEYAEGGILGLGFLKDGLLRSQLPKKELRVRMFD
ncbi:conserved hypothetical protein [uncultured Desulfatiglans sp.]|uniref:rRNA small subunit methyltransferase F RNA-binding PUA-like domain-containing protein n=1 Tax=Uncultured Desulfatiglans sp. TaxID=1748965 RepID=A0A653A5A2_UNCDX|nr:conserved hypothetical protein [uncultured Desulfatiglans sp.]